MADAGCAGPNDVTRSAAGSIPYDVNALFWSDAVQHGFSLRHTALAATNACDVVPQSVSFGIPDGRIITPGDAGRSVVLERASRRNANGMPPLALIVVDVASVSLISARIDSLTGRVP